MENILLFSPFGFLLPFSFEIYKKFWCTLIFSLFFSIMIEVMQVWTMRGYGQFDDILTNAAGAACGWLCNWRARTL
ncbi:MAG: VanZ family protein [Eubacterium sp.]|nr:VanZ family protein [Eubacterium sp.]